MTPGNWLPGRTANHRATLRLFCFPFAGGAAQVFRGWNKRLPDFVEVCAIQPPGRWQRMREPPLTSVSSLCVEACRGLEALFDLPFVFYGHSLGALVAYELTCKLRREAMVQPRALFVGSSGAPQLVPRGTERLYQLPDKELVEQIDRHYGSISPELRQHQDLLELLIPALRADMTAFGTYQYRERQPLDLPIAAFGGEADALVPREDLEQWRSQTTSRFSLEMFEGGHLFFQNDAEPLLRALAAHLGQLEGST